MIIQFSGNLTGLVKWKEPWGVITLKGVKVVVDCNKKIASNQIFKLSKIMFK
jgi:hypothetical protein